MKPIVGTTDYYFDMADKLVSLDATFVLIVTGRHEGQAILISNVERKDDAQNCLNHLCDNFLSRKLIPNPDEDGADEDSTDPMI